MPLDTKLYRVLIASPGDVAEEQDIIRQEIARWNSMHAVEMKMILLAVGWETDATPDLQEPGQAVINRQLVDTCDLLIGVFWTRLGTRTLQAESGTVEEIERFINEGKRCIVYFSDKEASPSNIDQKQYKRLQKYKQELNKKGLTNLYQELEEFREKVFRHITTAVQEIVKEDRERRAAEYEAKATERAIGLSLQPNQISNHLDTSFESITGTQDSVRRLLDSRFGIQDMEDAKEREITTIDSALSSPDLAALFNQIPTTEVISAIAQIFETVGTPSMYAISAIGKYGSDASIEWIDLAGDWVERLCTRKFESGYEWVSYIKTYPGLLLLYSLGISALRASKINFLREVLERQVYSYDYNCEFNLLDVIDPRCVFYRDIAQLIEPGFERRFTPVSDHLAPLIRSKLYHNEEESRYLNWFDLFEFLVSLKAVQMLNKYPYFGSFTWRNETNRFIIKSIQDAALRQGRYGTAISDLFNGDAGLEESAEKYDSIASQSRGDFGRTSPPAYVSKLIKLAKAGKRVTSYRDLVSD